MAIGYHQIEVHADDREKQRLVHPSGFFQVQCNAVRTRHRTCKVYATDENRIFGNVVHDVPRLPRRHNFFNSNYIEMQGRLDTALERLKQANLKLKLSKCTFEYFLGHVIRNKEISTDPEKLSRIKEWPRPHNPD